MRRTRAILVTTALLMPTAAQAGPRSWDTASGVGRDILVAAALEKRCGWRAGFPALVIATFVGVARVEADNHCLERGLA